MLPVVSIDVHGTPTIGTGAHLPGIGCTGGQAAQGDAGVGTDAGGRSTAAGGVVAVAIVINSATHRLPLQRHRRRLVRCAIDRRRLTKCRRRWWYDREGMMLPVVSIDVHGTPTIGTGAHLPGIGCTGGQAAQGDAGVGTDTGGRGTAAGGVVAVAIVINSATRRLPLQRHRRRLVRYAIGRRRLIERESSTLPQTHHGSRRASHHTPLPWWGSR